MFAAASFSVVQGCGRIGFGAGERMDSSADSGANVATVALMVAGDGAAVVRSNPAGVLCPTTCAASFPIGTVVTFTAMLDESRVVGWSEASCGQASSCMVVAGQTSALRLDVVGLHNVIFTTSKDYTLDAIGGLAGADGICASLATAAGLAGRYIAWLSTTTVNAIDRIGSARGWVRPDGLPVVDMINAAPIYYPPALDETGARIVAPGQSPGSFQVYTGTNSAGMLNQGTCGDWTDPGSSDLATFGFPTYTTSAWTDHSRTTCVRTNRLYCIGVDYVRGLGPIVPLQGRTAFLTDAVLLSGGIAEADATCQTSAQSAGILGRFRAFLSTTTVPAASRFDANGSTWVRVDGIALAPSANDVLAGVFSTSLNVTAAGEYVTGAVSTGSSTPQMTSVETCVDWTSTSSGDQGWVGRVNDSSREAWGGSVGQCALPRRLYCLEE